MCEAVGKSSSAVSKIATGQSPLPDEWIPAVAAVLGVSEFELIVAKALDGAGVRLELDAFRRVVAAILSELSE